MIGAVVRRENVVCRVLVREESMGRTREAGVLKWDGFPLKENLGKQMMLVGPDNAISFRLKIISVFRSSSS